MASWQEARLAEMQRRLRALERRVGRVERGQARASQLWNFWGGYRSKPEPAPPDSVVTPCCGGIRIPKTLRLVRNINPPTWGIATWDEAEQAWIGPISYTTLGYATAAPNPPNLPTCIGFLPTGITVHEVVTFRCQFFAGPPARWDFAFSRRFKACLQSGSPAPMANTPGDYNYDSPFQGTTFPSTCNPFRWDFNGYVFQDMSLPY